MNRQIAMLYPFSLSTASIPRFRHLLNELDLRHLVAPVSMGVVGMDSSRVDEGPVTGMQVSSSFEEALEKCTVLIAAEYEFDDNTHYFNKVIENLKLAIIKQKNTYCTLPLEPPVISEFDQLAKEHGSMFTYMKGPCLDAASISELSNKKNLKLNTPVVAVMGLGPNCSKFEIQLGLRENILKKGFKVSQIGSKHYCELFGFHSFPSFMYSNEYDEETKIFAFSRFLRDIEIRENPDVIILGIPEGIMKYNDRIINRFGTLAYEVGCAVTSDYTVLSLPCEEINNEYIAMLVECLKYRNSMVLDSLSISNIHINEDSINKEYMPVSFDVMPDSYVDLVCKDYTLPTPSIYKSYRSDDVARLADAICDQLSGNIDRVDIEVLKEDVLV